MHKTKGTWSSVLTKERDVLYFSNKKKGNHCKFVKENLGRLLKQVILHVRDRRCTVYGGIKDWR